MRNKIFESFKSIIKNSITFLDIVILCLAVSAFIAGLYFFLPKQGAGRPVLIIESDGKSWEYNLNRDIDIIIPGKIGNVMVCIHDGKAAICEAQCRDQICVHAGFIERAGEWVACLPSAVIIRIQNYGKIEENDDLIPDASTF